MAGRALSPPSSLVGFACAARSAALLRLVALPPLTLLRLVARARSRALFGGEASEPEGGEAAEGWSEMEGRWRGDGGEMEGRWRGDGGEMEGRYRGDIVPEGGEAAEGWSERARAR